MAQKLKQINDISIGDNLRKLRNAANLTQEQVVAQLQLRNLPTSRSVYSQIEAGTYNIRISELIALAEIFHTDFNTIFPSKWSLTCCNAPLNSSMISLFPKTLSSSVTGTSLKLPEFLDFKIISFPLRAMFKNLVWFALKSLVLIIIINSYKPVECII